MVGIVKNYIKKGSKLYIEGQLQTRKWTDNNGVDKYTTEIVLQNFNSSLQMLDNRSNPDNDFSASPTTEDSKKTNNETFAEELDDEIPF